jgi:hypothetical protein
LKSALRVRYLAFTLFQNKVLFLLLQVLRRPASLAKQEIMCTFTVQCTVLCVLTTVCTPVLSPKQISATERLHGSTRLLKGAAAIVILVLPANWIHLQHTNRARS